MEEWQKEKKYLKIAKELLLKGEMNATQVAKIVGNPNAAIRRIHDLIKKYGAVEDLAVGRGDRGRAARYTLTKDGREATIHELSFEAFELVESVVRTIDRCSKQDKDDYEVVFEKYLKAVRREDKKETPVLYVDLADPDGQPVKTSMSSMKHIEDLNVISQHSVDVFLRDILKIVYDHYMKQLKPCQKANFAVIFNKEGTTLLIPFSLLHKKGVALGME